MNKLVALFALVLIVSFGAFAQPEPSTTSLSDASAIVSLPNFVQEMTQVRIETIKDIDYTYTWRHDVIAWGTGTYRLTNCQGIPFHWVSYKNDDDWFQVELSTRVYGFDLAPIRKIPDTLGRRIYETEVKNEGQWRTWIGTSNDWGFGPEMYQGGQMGLAWKFSDDQGRVDMMAVTRYYLDRISGATPALQFEVRGVFTNNQ